MDNLARNAMLAKQAGMSYGRWKAMQQPVKVEKQIPEGWLVCQNCGKAFKPKTKKKQSYCDVNCQKQAYRRKERQQKKERSEMAERCLFCGEIIPEGRQVCPNCERKVDNG